MLRLNVTTVHYDLGLLFLTEKFGASFSAVANLISSADTNCQHLLVLFAFLEEGNLET